jgi:IS1 family transposase
MTENSRYLFLKMLFKINGQHYWLWLAYEPFYMSVCNLIYQGKERSSYVTSSLNKSERNLETSLSVLMVHIDTIMMLTDDP